MKILNACVAAIFIIAWCVLGAFIGNKISAGGQVVEISGLFAGLSIGLFLAWSTQQLAEDRRKKILK